MRCPHCSEEIHDQALKCPYCQRLLVRKPGWQRRPPQPVQRSAGGPAGPSAAASVRQAVDAPPPRGARRPPSERTDAPPRRAGGAGSGRILLSLGVALFMAAAGLAGYMAGRTVTDAPVTVVADDGDRIAELEGLAEERLDEIRRLRQRLSSAPGTPSTPSPPQRRLIAALGSCDEAFRLLIDLEEAMFADRAALGRFVQLSNRCLAPLGRQIRVPA